MFKPWKALHFASSQSAADEVEDAPLPQRSPRRAVVSLVPGASRAERRDFQQMLPGTCRVPRSPRLHGAPEPFGAKGLSACTSGTRAWLKVPPPARENQNSKDSSAVRPFFEASLSNGNQWNSYGIHMQLIWNSCKTSVCSQWRLLPSTYWGCQALASIRLARLF